MARIAIGIDLGTLYSCVAIYENGRVEIITDLQDRRVIPSYVAFNPRERLIGDAARSQMSINPENTIFETKRLIGRRFYDETVQADMKHWPFKVINDNGKPKIQIKYKNQIKLFTPEEISSMILSKLKDIAEMYLQKKVTEAVISVPSYFNESQRQATINAGTIAGLNILRLINEPAAAAIAYHLPRQERGERDVLILDLGSSCNISVLKIEEGIIEVKSTAGNPHLGGIHFDSRMVEYCVQEFQRKYGKNLMDNKRALRRLRTACESAKLTLSLSRHATIEIDSLHDGIDFYSTITRDCFEELNNDLFSSIFQLIEKALHDATMPKESIKDIVLVGGSTRIPKIQQLLKEFFNGKELNQTINPDEAVACGAAIEAAILTGNKSEEVKDLLLLDVAPITLGIETVGGVMTTLIKRNTTIPAKITQTFSLEQLPKNECGAVVKIFEGENALIEKNHLLGSLELPPISIKSDDESPQFQITFDIDAFYTLIVSAVEMRSRQETKITTRNSQEHLSQDEIGRMIADGEKYKQEDERRRQCVNAKNALEAYCFNIKTRINEEKLEHKINAHDKKILIDTLEDALTWGETNQTAEKEDFEKKSKEIKNLYASIMRKPYVSDLEENIPRSIPTSVSSSSDKSSKVTSRFLDIQNEHIDMLLPIEGYEEMPLLSVEDTIKHLEDTISNVRRNAYIAKQRSTSAVDSLTSDESAAIQLYTIEWIQRDQSFYIYLNNALREINREKLIPYFLYLKLVLTALWKIPSDKKTVWCGAKGDVSTHYPIGKEFVWWGFCSCIESFQSFEEKFLGTSEVRTIFSIKCENGKSIRLHSYYKTDDEILLLPGTRFRVLDQSSKSNGRITIQLQEIKSPFPMLQPPFK